MNKIPRGLASSLTTSELATALKIQAQSIRKRWTQTGSYFGLRPDKCRNGRLLWPLDAVEAFLKGETAE